MLERKSLQSDWFQSHELLHNIINLTGNIVIFKCNNVLFINYLFGKTKTLLGELHLLI